LQGGYDEVRDAHADGASNENGLPAELVDIQHRGDSGEEEENAADP